MNRSLTLCASILLLSPLSLAAISAGDFVVDFGIGHKFVTLGDNKDTKQTLFGAVTHTGTSNVFTGAGTSTSQSFGSPVITASVAFKMGGNFKLSAEAFMPGSDSRKVNDVTSSVSTVTGTISSSGETDNGIVIITGTTGGVNTLDVSQKVGLAGKAEYVFGDETNGATIGGAIFRSTDEYSYTASIMNAAALAADDGAGHTGGQVSEANTAKAITYAVTPSAHQKFDDAVMWIGAVASASSQITDNLSFRAGAGYYMRDFEASKQATTGPRLFTADTPSKMVLCNVSLAFHKAE
jgi:hypothetical protein